MVLSVSDNQTIFDIAVLHGGNADYVFDILRADNKIRLENISGKSILMPKEKTTIKTQFLQKFNIATGITNPEPWILDTAFWDDQAKWIDTRFWKDLF